MDKNILVSPKPKKVMANRKDMENGVINQELQVYLTEYTALRGEVISCLDTQRQLLSLELAVIGVAVSGVTFLQAQPLLYLFGALLLGLLSWIMFEQTLKVQLFYDYFDTVLCENVGKSINKPDCKAFGWQSRWFSISLRTTFYGILSIAKFMLGFLLAISFCILFLNYQEQCWNFLFTLVS